MKEKLIAIVAEYLGKETLEIEADTTFEDLGLDSLDIAELGVPIRELIGVIENTGVAENVKLEAVE